MSLADQLLIGWWVAAIALFIAWLVRRDLSQNSRAFLLVGIILFVCWLVIFWLGNETRLYVFSSQISCAIIGAAITWVAFTGPNNLKLRPLFERALRIFIFGGGAFVLIFFSFILIKDIFYPWQVVEGRVGDLRDFRGARQAWYSVWIDGHRHRTTHDVYAGLHIGDRVRAEIGSGSGMIFRLQPAVTPR